MDETWAHAPEVPVSTPNVGSVDYEELETDGKLKYGVGSFGCLNPLPPQSHFIGDALADVCYSKWPKSEGSKHLWVGSSGCLKPPSSQSLCPSVICSLFVCPSVRACVMV